jgi:hypothetical protein
LRTAPQEESNTIAERTAEPVDGRLRRNAAERLLEWSFSRGDIAATLGYSEAWVREVHETQQLDESWRSTEHRSSSGDDHTTE